eukprot:TRINITY_DN9625_c0_g1_i2.p1 TRINITY_DN9625_c0_g1~~TRINITY_DN9625_c0_g1_i2.p1  ORF type:complete len:257 (+),score=32.90 TRINITY_DN9625_c0_g1_i2:77-847(+)
MGRMHWTPQFKTDGSLPAVVQRPIRDHEVSEYLARYAYGASDHLRWQKDPIFRPVITLGVTGHDEIVSDALESHTNYHIDATFSIWSFKNAREPPARWRISRRLCWLRVEVHDQVKSMMQDMKGTSFEDYPTFFKDCNFAHHGGLPGTTKKLDAWFRRLAEGVNKRIVPPRVAAVLMNQLRTPEPLVPCDLPARPSQVRPLPGEGLSQFLSSDAGTPSFEVMGSTGYRPVDPVRGRSSAQCVVPGCTMYVFMKNMT